MDKSSYRSDIDGLRALAVLLVVIFHAGFDFIPGGYIGVDVFFVISGFLITGIIKVDLMNERFSFSNFYKRRIQRLMPALFLVLLVTTIIAFFILLPQDFSSYGRSVIAVVLSLSNVYFWRENGGYFDGNVQEIPLLHTWSLSVEEQFYLVWPLFMVLTAKYLEKKIYLWMLLAITFLGVWFSQWVSEITFGAAYYLLPTRAFELLMGSILALSWNRLPILPVILMNILSSLGISLIIGSAIYLDESSSFPGYNAAIPALGTVLLLYTGRSKNSIVNDFLSLSPIVWVGLISYSLYLWHWPVVVFIRYMGIELTTGVSCLIVILSVLLGWLSWKYVEIPFRKSKHINFKPVFKKYYLVPTSLTIILGMGITLSYGIPSRFSPDVIEMEKAVASKPASLRKGCHSPTRLSQTKPSSECQLGNENNHKIKALLIGDSHANHLTGFMGELAKNADISLIDYTLDECIPIFDLNWGHNLYYSNICRERNELTQSFIAKNTFDYVLLAGYWPTPNGYIYVFDNNHKPITKENFQDIFVKKLSRTIESIESTGAKVILVKDVAPNGHTSPKCEIKRMLFNEDLKCDIEKEIVNSRDSMINKVFFNLTKVYPKLLVLDPKVAMCDENYCYSFLDKTPLFLDDSHLNEKGSSVLGRRYIEHSGNPFL
ncbi:MAG: peptidoglycan/LPS O-acetylase OafA/YrhL [Bermanella sp.]|jgi:peptidoglycan/LPS O-acetylase OafA/YrhL